MMRILAANHVDVHIHAELIGEGRVKLVGQIGVEIADATRPDFYVVRKVGPAAQVDHDLGQSLV